MADEHVLITAMKGGSHDAFNQLYGLYAGRLFVFCQRVTKNTALAEDIVQEAFIALWENRQSIRNEQSVSSLLFLMAKGRAINGLRKTLNAETYLKYVQTQHAEATSADKQLMYEDFLSVIDSALSHLNPTQQKVIRLSKIENMRIRDIAEQLGLSEQTVKNSLSTGMKQLRNIMKKDYGLVLLYLVNYWL